jgi:hypothetical protein
VTGVPDIEVVIDEVVLRGVSREASWSVAAAIETELHARAASWAGRGLTLDDRSEASRRLPRVSAPAGSPGALGGAVAGAVWGSIETGGRR